MRINLSLLLLTLLTLSLVVDTANAGLFSRVWDRRKAEIRGELSHDVNRKVASAAEELGSNLDKQFSDEAAELQSSFKQQVEAMHQQAEKLVAAESARLQKQINQEFAKMRTLATENLASERKALSKQMDQQVTKLRSDAKTKLDSMTAELEERSRKNQQTVEMLVQVNQKATNKKLAQQMNVMKKELTEMLEQQVGTRNTQSPAENSDSNSDSLGSNRALKSESLQLVTEESAQ